MSIHVKYIVIEPDIHHFLWLDNSREAVYEHAEYYRQLNSELPKDSVFRVLIDLRRSGAPPFQILADALKKSNPRKDITFRTAYLASDHLVEILMKNFAIINRIGGNRSFFSEDQEEEAITWLAEN